MKIPSAAWVLAVPLVLLVAAEALLASPHFFTGFHAVVGLGSCAAVVALAKAVGRAGLQEPEEGDDA